MKRLIYVVVLVAGCSDGPTYNIGGHSLVQRSGQYITNPTGYFCGGLASNQVKVTLVDWSPVCLAHAPPNTPGPDPTIEHSKLDFVLSLGGWPMFLRSPFVIDPTVPVTCDGGGASAFVQFQHTPPDTDVPDQMVAAKSGTIKVTQYDAVNKLAMKASFDLDFGAGSHISGSFSVDNCD